MKIRVSSRWAVMLACVVLSCPRPSVAFSFSCRTKNVGEVVAATAFFVGALALLSMDEEYSHEDFCSKMQSMFDDVSATYDSECSIVAQETSSWHSDARQVNEPLLYKLAVAKRDKSCISRYIEDLNREIRKLRASIEKLSTRMDQMDRVSYCSVYSRAKRLKSSLNSLLDTLLLLYDVLTAHKTYFELYEVEDAIWRNYSNELDLLYDTTLPYYRLASGMHAVVKRRCNAWWESSPYLTYASTLRDTIDQLHNYVLITPAYYHDRIGAADQLIDKLYCLETLLVNDPQYEYELSLD